MTSTPWYDLTPSISETVDAHQDLRIPAFFTCKGELASADKPETAGITFESTPHYLSTRLERDELFVLTDGERIPLGRPAARDSKLNFKYLDTITEWLEYRMPVTALKKTASAKKVEMRLGQFEFVLDDFPRSTQKLVAIIPN